MLQQLQKPVLLIIAIWLLLTSVNIMKPFQMDDAFHLEAAKNILNDPLRPMSGMIRWDYDEPTPMYVANQPPLLFYMIAAISSIFGFKEIPLHLLISVFTFLALYWFYKSACLIGSQKPLVLLGLFGLCPALMVNQNVMTDVPVLSLLIGALYYLLLWDKTGKSKFSLFAILLLSIAFFIKYTVLPLLVATALIFILKKDYKKLLLLLIPLALILLWTTWNYWEFGGSHILSRKPGARSTLEERAWAFFTCLGSIAPFGALFLTYLVKEKIAAFLVYITSVLFIITAALFYMGTGAGEDQLTKYLEISFFINGAIIFLSTMLLFFKKNTKGNKSQVISQLQQPIIFIFLGALTIFLIGLAPFMGTRHLLLLVPFFLLLANPVIEKCSNALLTFSLTASLLLSLLLGISDWKYAFYYKNTAAGIMKGMPPGSKVWATGTGGWQWYSKQNGMTQYSVETAHIKPGDYIVIASGLPAYKISADIKYAMLAKIWGETSPFDYFSVSNGGSLYSASFGKPSWRLSKRTKDTVYVCRCIN